MLEPLVSIGVPTFNRPKTLERTLKSLVNQTYKNIEIVISDNCSTDINVELVIEKFIGDPRLGISNKVEIMAQFLTSILFWISLRVMYFMRIGDDDWLDSNYIESCITFFS